MHEALAGDPPVEQGPMSMHQGLRKVSKLTQTQYGCTPFVL